MIHDVFISYAHGDSEFAIAVADQLKSAGLQVWIDTEQLPAGENWREEIDNAIANTYVLLVIMTLEAKESEYVTYEWAYALGKGIKVILIQHAPVQLHPRLELLQYLDFTDSTRYPWERLIRRIRDILNSHPIRAVYLAASGHDGATASGDPPNIVSRFLGTARQALRQHGQDRKQSDFYNNEGRRQIRDFGVRGGFQDGQAWWLVFLAIEYYVEAIKYDPTNQYPWTNLAYAYHIMGRSKHASDCLELAFKLATPGPNHPGNHYRLVKKAIDTNTYDSGDDVIPQEIPNRFREAFGQYL